MISDGILLVDKEVGQTSREVDDLVGRKLQIRKVGHLGTLDPFASGLLVLGLGEGTKLFPFLEDGRKSYQASLKLGTATDTGDLSGKETMRSAVPFLDEEKVREAVRSLLGKREQIPPMFSAKRVGGTRAYALARRGEQVVLPPSPIVVYQIELLSLTHDEISFECTVSKGTYIRALGEDIARRLKAVGHLTRLRRKSVGSFSVEDAKPIKEIKKTDLIPLVEALKDSQRRFVSGTDEEKAVNGALLNLPCSREFVFLLGSSGNVLSLYRKKKEGEYRSAKGFVRSRKSFLGRRVDALERIPRLGRCAMAIGEFDGLHQGHLKVLSRLKESKLPRYVLTFSDDFKARLFGVPPRFLMSTDEKVEALRSFAFLDGVIALEYSDALVGMTPEEFIRKVLLPMGVEEIAVGEDFRFGKAGLGDSSTLRNAGLRTYAVPLLTYRDGKVSSTFIKEIVKEGAMEEASRLLGHYYSIACEVLHGEKNGRKLGFPTINQSPGEEKVLPPKGVYKSFVFRNDRVFHAMTNVGIHPTLGALSKPIVETTILDGYDEDLYGEVVRVFFERRIRDEVRFSSLDALVSQLERDEAICSKGEVDFSLGPYPLL